MSAILGPKHGIVLVCRNTGRDLWECRRVSDGLSLCDISTASATLTGIDFSVREGVVTIVVGTSHGDLYVAWVDVPRADSPAGAGTGAEGGCASEGTAKSETESTFTSMLRTIATPVITLDKTIAAESSSSSRALSLNTEPIAGVSRSDVGEFWVVARLDSALHYFTDDKLGPLSEGRGCSGYKCLHSLVASPCRLVPPVVKAEDISGSAATEGEGAGVGDGAKAVVAGDTVTALLAIDAQDVSLLFVTRCFGLQEPCRLAVVGLASGRVLGVVLPRAEDSTALEIAFELDYGHSVVGISLTRVQHLAGQAATHMVLCLSNGLVHCEGVRVGGESSQCRDRAETWCMQLPPDAARAPGQQRCDVVSWRDGVMYAQPDAGVVSAASLFQSLGEGRSQWRVVRDCSSCRPRACAVSVHMDTIAILLDTGVVEVYASSLACDERDGNGGGGVRELTRLLGVSPQMSSSCSSSSTSVGIGDRISAEIDATQSEMTRRDLLERRIAALDKQIWWLSAVLQSTGAAGKDSLSSLSLEEFFDMDVFAVNKSRNGGATGHSITIQVRLSTVNSSILTIVQGQMLNISLRPSDDMTYTTSVMQTTTQSVCMDFTAPMGLKDFSFETSVSFEPGSIRALDMDLSVQVAFLPGDPLERADAHGAFVLPIKLGSASIGLAQVARALMDASALSVHQWCGPTSPRASALGTDEAMFFLGLPGVVSRTGHRPSPSSSPSVLSMLTTLPTDSNSMDANHRLPFTLPSFGHDARQVSGGVLGRGQGQCRGLGKEGQGHGQGAIRIWHSGSGVRRAQSSSAALVAAAHAAACEDVLHALAPDPASTKANTPTDPTTTAAAAAPRDDAFCASDCYSLPIPLQQTMAECAELRAQLRRRGHVVNQANTYSNENEQLSALWRLYTNVRDAAC